MNEDNSLIQESKPRNLIANDENPLFEEEDPDNSDETLINPQGRGMVSEQIPINPNYNNRESRMETSSTSSRPDPIKAMLVDLPPSDGDGQNEGALSLQKWCGDISNFICFPFNFITGNNRYRIGPYQIGIRLKAGAFDAYLKPGIYYINTFLYEMKIVDMRAKLMEIPSESIMTSDNVQLHLKSYLKYRIVDPYKACYRINNFEYALKLLAQGAKKNALAEFKMNDLLHNTRAFVDDMKSKIGDRCLIFGIEILDIGLTNVNLPDDMVIP